MKNWLTTLPAALALTSGLFWFAVAPAFADCVIVGLCLEYQGVTVCVSWPECF